MEVMQSMMPNLNMPNTSNYSPSTPSTPQILVTAPTPISSVQMGKLLRSYAGNPFRFIGIVLWAGISAFGVLASISEKSGIGFLFWLASGASCYAYYSYVQRDAHAEIYEQGFAISRGGKTISGRWEDIEKVEHWVKQSYMYGVVPVGGKNHSFTIVLKNGARVKVTSAFQQSQHLGVVIQGMWANANAKR